MKGSRALLVALALLFPLFGCDDGGDLRAYDQARPRVSLRGTGATASRALFARWGQEYALVDPQTTLVYEATGSGAGMAAATDATADFGTSDSPLSDADASAHPEILHLPVAVEAIAVVYAVSGAPQHLQVTEDVLSDLLTGAIAWWDDPALAALNARTKLPHVPVRPIYRGDPSGSSYLLSEWLKKASRRWPFAPTRALTLPVGVAAQRDDGVLARLRATDGSIGYLSAATATSEHLATLALRNTSGAFVTPTLEALRAAASAANLGGDLRAHAIASPGDLAYPICSFTFVLVRAEGPGLPARRALARFLWWATHDGQELAPLLGFGALPGELQVRDEGVLRSLRSGGERLL